MAKITNFGGLKNIINKQVKKKRRNLSMLLGILNEEVSTE